MKDFKIDKSFPMPKKTGKGRPCIYPWDKMEVGDSFFVQGKTHSGLQVSATLWAERNGFDWKFVQRRENDGFRIWRVK